jgi:hypothetical protein
MNGGSGPDEAMRDCCANRLEQHNPNPRIMAVLTLMAHPNNCVALSKKLRDYERVFRVAQLIFYLLAT